MRKILALLLAVAVAGCTATTQGSTTSTTMRPAVTVDDLDGTDLDGTDLDDGAGDHDRARPVGVRPVRRLRPSRRDPGPPAAAGCVAHQRRWSPLDFTRPAPVTAAVAAADLQDLAAAARSSRRSPRPL